MSSEGVGEALAESPAGQSDASGPQPESTRLAFLTNFIPPYWKPVLRCLSTRYPRMRVLVSTAMEADRTWKVDWEGLDVVLQRTVTLETRIRNPLGFRELVYVHLPIDTVLQLRRFKPRVVISAEFGFRTLLAIVYRRLHPTSRLILYADLSERTEQARGWFRVLIRKLIARNVDSFVVLGEGGARYVRQLGVANDKIFKVPYATDVSRFQDNTPRRSEESARRLLYVGRLVERKGLLQFLAVLSEWVAAHPGRSAELVLAGDGPLRKRLEQAELPAGLRLIFLGDKEYDDMPAVYAQSGILVFPTFADTWGLVVNEALAAGLPVLGSVYSQAVEELIQDDWNGWTYRTDRADEMLAAIDRSMTVSVDTLDEMRERGRSSALRLTSEDMARRIETVVDCAVMRRERAQTT